MAGFEDADLVKQYLSGNNQALDALIQRYFRQVFLFAKTYVKTDAAAEDIVQEVFVKIWKNLGKYDTGKKFKTWAFQITKNTCLDYLRKHKQLLEAGELSQEQIDYQLAGLVDQNPLPQSLLEAKDFSERLDKAMGKLSPMYRQAVELHLLHDLTFQEIADVLNLPINTVKSRYRRALVALRGHLAE